MQKENNVKTYRRRQQEILLISYVSFYWRDQRNLVDVFICANQPFVQSAIKPLKHDIAFLCQRTCWQWWVSIAHESDQNFQKSKKPYELNCISPNCDRLFRRLPVVKNELDSLHFELSCLFKKVAKAKLSEWVSKVIGLVWLQYSHWFV